MLATRNARLVLYGSAAYALAVYIYGGLVQTSIQSTVALLVIPLSLLTVIIYSDLALRAKTPSKPQKPKALSERSLSHQVQLLSRQIEVGSRSSRDYYDNVLLNRLKELIIEKINIETGLNRPNIANTLTNPHLGPGLLKDDMLYDLLFNRPRKVSRKERQRTLEIIADRISGWKA